MSGDDTVTAVEDASESASPVGAAKTPKSIGGGSDARETPAQSSTMLAYDMAMPHVDGATVEHQAQLLIELNDRVRILSDELREQEVRAAEAEKREAETRERTVREQAAAQRKMADRNDAVEAARDEARRLQEAVEKAEAEAERANKRLAELDVTAAEGWQQVGAQNQAVQGLRAKSVFLRKMFMKEKRRREKEEREKEAVKLRFKPLKERNVELEYRLANQRDAMGEADAEVSRLTGALKAQADAADNLSRRLRAEISDRERAAEQAARKHLQVRELYEDNIELVSKLEGAERGREEARTALVAAAAELDAARARLESMERRAADDRRAQNTSARQLAECEAERDEQAQHAADLDAALAEEQAAHGETLARAHATAEDLAALRCALGELLSVFMAPAGGRVPFREKAEAELRLGRLLKGLRQAGVPTANAIALRGAKVYELGAPPPGGDAIGLVPTPRAPPRAIPSPTAVVVPALPAIVGAVSPPLQPLPALPLPAAVAQ